MQLILTYGLHFPKENTAFSFERTSSQLSGGSNGKPKSLIQPDLVQTWMVLTNVGAFIDRRRPHREQLTETDDSACMIINE